MFKHPNHFYVQLEGGTLLFAGATDWKFVGRKTGELSKSANTQWSPTRLAALKDVKIVAVSKNCASPNCFAVDEEGQVWAWGRNEAGQLGLGDSEDRFVTKTNALMVKLMKPNRFVPTLVNALSGYDVVEVATGKAHALFLTSCGKVSNGSDD